MCPWSHCEAGSGGGGYPQGEVRWRDGGLNQAARGRLLLAGTVGSLPPTGSETLRGFQQPCLSLLGVQHIEAPTCPTKGTVGGNNGNQETQSCSHREKIYIFIFRMHWPSTACSQNNLWRLTIDYCEGGLFSSFYSDIWLQLLPHLLDKRTLLIHRYLKDCFFLTKHPSFLVHQAQLRVWEKIKQ